LTGVTQLKDYKLRFDDLGIIDLEFTSWKDSLKRNWSLEWEKKEIINIGAIKFNKKFENKIFEKSFFFKPKKNKLSTYFQKLTSISQSKINSSNFLKDKDLEKINFFFKNTEFIFSNGIDEVILKEDLKEKRINYKKYSFLDKIINIKPLIAKLLNIDENAAISSDLPKLVGINRGESLKKHLAVDDAKAIFFCLRHLNNEGILTFDTLIKFSKRNGK
jgi:inhibitor of KinA sporulation pathway (predicted exonuclease)